MNWQQIEYSRSDAQQDGFEARVKALASEWSEQLDKTGVINHRAFGDPVTYIDLVDWAKSDGFEYLYNREDDRPILEYHASAYLSGEWD